MATHVGDEGIYQPDFIGKIVNTLPARQGVGWYLKLNYHY